METSATDEQIKKQDAELEGARFSFADIPILFLYAIRGIFLWFFNNINTLARWVYRQFNRFFGFFKNPGENSRIVSARFKEAVIQLRREMDTLSWVQLTAIIVIFGLFLIAPLLSVVTASFITESGFSLDLITQLFSNPAYVPQWQPSNFNWIRPTGAGNVEIWGIDLGIILNSVYVAVAVTIIAVILGTSFAFIIARYEFSGKGVLRTLLLFPMLSTPFIGAIGIKWFLNANGFLNNWAVVIFGSVGLEWTRFEFHGLMAIIIVQGFSLFSLVYLNAYSSFMSIDPALEEQAENLGATGFKLFRSVTFPLAMPGIQAGAILTFILSIEDLGTPIVYSEDLQAQKVLAFQVFDSIIGESGQIDPLGPAIGMILLVFALSGFLAIRKYASLRSYTSGSKGGQWNPRSRVLKRKTTLLLYLVIIPVLLFALIPQISVILLSIVQFRSSALFPPLTLDNYAIIFNRDILNAIGNTLKYAGIATIGIVLLGVSAAYIISRRNIPGKTALDMLVTSPIALPGIVIATGYFTLFYNTPFFPIGAPAFLITMSYLVRKFPFTVRAAYAGLQQTPIELEEASLNVGASRNKTFGSIVIPLIGVSVLAGALLSFVYCVSEVSTSLLLGGSNYGEAPLTYWIRDVNAGLPPLYGAGPAAALGVLMMILQMIVITVTNAILKTRASAMTGI
ncbi:MAG: iron ABC transporter permease [Candidatus Thorarchaeota archaeon]|nr:MAG: iron ABC transporter permease [Candidatus Thorarchaeota archaeon]